MQRFSANPTRSEALFASDLQPSQHPTRAQINLAIAAMLQQVGSPACAACVAQEFGDHPETATLRMQWAREAAGAPVVAANTPPATIHAAPSAPPADGTRWVPNIPLT